MNSVQSLLPYGHPGDSLLRCVDPENQKHVRRHSPVYLQITVSSRKLTRQWKIHMSNRKYIFKCSVFGCHVRFWGEYFNLQLHIIFRTLSAWWSSTHPPHTRRSFLHYFCESGRPLMFTCGEAKSFKWKPRGVSHVVSRRQKALMKRIGGLASLYVYRLDNMLVFYLFITSHLKIYEWSELLIIFPRVFWQGEDSKKTSSISWFSCSKSPHLLGFWESACLIFTTYTMRENPAVWSWNILCSEPCILTLTEVAKDMFNNVPPPPF